MLKISTLVVAKRQIPYNFLIVIVIATPAELSSRFLSSHPLNAKIEAQKPHLVSDITHQ